jgi:peptidoglycan/LPS O-acetylase OafA/YrhL
MAEMRRFAWFDCVRCVAIFMVMVAHCGYPYATLPGVLSIIVDQAQKIGYIGVDLFFVLSGFLVSGLLFDEHDATGTLDIRRFLIRRAFKIIPAFYVLVFVTLMYDKAVRGEFNGTHLFHDIFFLQSYRAGAWPHAWTLAIEVHFYILVALLLAWLSRNPKDGAWLKRLPGILWGVLIAVFVARLINSGIRTGNFNLHREIEPTHLHLDVLAAGVLLRYLYTYHREALALFDRCRVLWIGLGLLFVYPSEFIWQPHAAWLTAIIPTFNYLGFGLILFEATQIPFPVHGTARWLVLPFDYLGKHSYSIYLWHLPVRDWIVVPLFPERGPLYVVIYFLASLAIGTLFSEILEMPVLHLRNRLFPSARPTGAPRELAPLTATGGRV